MEGKCSGTYKYRSLVFGSEVKFRCADDRVVSSLGVYGVEIHE